MKPKYGLRAINETGDKTIDVQNIVVPDSAITAGSGTVNMATAIGDVVGPSSAVNNNLAAFDGTTGKLIQNSAVTISDAGAMTVADLTDSSLTSGRVVYAGAGGNLIDSANLTFNGTTATANALTVTNDVTLNGGAANGVAYLNGSKVLTTNSALQFDGSNLGLGVSLSAWNSGWKAIQNTGGALYSNSGNQRLGFNAYLDSGGTFKYIATGFATDYQQGAGNGSHVWYTSPSGTSGDTITFTQAMTLSAMGNLTVAGTITATACFGINGGTF